MKQFARYLFRGTTTDIWFQLSLKRWYSPMFAIRRNDGRASWEFSFAFIVLYFTCSFEGFYEPIVKPSEETIRELSFHNSGWMLYWCLWANPRSMAEEGTWRLNELHILDFLFGQEQTTQEEVNNGKYAFEFALYHQQVEPAYPATYTEYVITTKRPRAFWKKQRYVVKVQFIDPVPIPETDGFGTEDDEVWQMTAPGKTIAEAVDKIVKEIDDHRAKAGEGWYPGRDSEVDDDDIRFDLAPMVGSEFMSNIAPINEEE